MRKAIFGLAAAAMLATANCSNAKSEKQGDNAADDSTVSMADTAIVYFTSEITPESLVKVFKALGVDPTGNVAVKISTGEGGNTHYLKPELIGALVKDVDGAIVECCTAYGGTRQDPKKHWETIRDHGFDKIAKVDIMDEFGEINIPVADTTHIKYDIVGKNIENYDFMINLAHFKGHAMGGYGGVLKNASIGVASSNGKAYIHTAGKVAVPDSLWSNLPEQDHFLESMASAAQAVHNYMNGKSADGKPRVVYINVMNNLSVDCDCDGTPEAPALKDMGIAASLDPVAVDKACLDMVFNHVSTEGDDSAPLIERINRQHGTYIIPYAVKIGLGTENYKLVEVK